MYLTKIGLDILQVLSEIALDCIIWSEGKFLNLLARFFHRCHRKCVVECPPKITLDSFNTSCSRSQLDRHHVSLDDYMKTSKCVREDDINWQGKFSFNTF